MSEQFATQKNNMTELRGVPISLKVVAGLFILSGVLSLIDVIVSLFQGGINLNLGVLGLFIGAGLLRLSPTWRGWALVFTWIEIIGAPIIGVLFLVLPGPLNYRLWGQPAGNAPKAAGVALALVVFLIALWQLRVLTRPGVRALFQQRGAQP
jgi:hypothetical protein